MKLLTNWTRQELLGLNVPFYNSTHGLTVRLYDYSNVYILPLICVFGLLTGFINIFILIKTGIKKNVHSYMLIGAISDTLFLFIQIFTVVIRCGTLCPYGYTYASKAYELYVYLYLGFTIITFSAFVDISMSIERIMLFTNSHKTIIKRKNFGVRCLLLFILSGLVMMPYFVLAREIVPRAVLVRFNDIGNQSTATYEILYMISFKKYWLQSSLQSLMTSILIFKGPALICLVLLVDILVIIKFKNYLKNKRKLSSSKYPCILRAI